ncbi:hypothetical protein L484_013557 [Morus notabilis]|uniref:Uncharacterized protein n=1 Tax=Morus notabilis TaxID=981085 RepID=W9QPA4_9ROSA|nr:hypothetical protein L484_013557 [Morus notabilis]
MSSEISFPAYFQDLPGGARRRSGDKLPNDACNLPGPVSKFEMTQRRIAGSSLLKPRIKPSQTETEYRS